MSKNGGFIELFPYQIIGARWLSEMRAALLADDMGLGKSAQVIRACNIINAKHVLIICPSIARPNWKRQFDLFSIFDYPIHVVEKLTKNLPFNGVTIVSFEGATHAENIDQYCVSVVDERHYLKSLTSKRSKAVYGKNGIIRFTKRHWELSGTPAPNHAGELWSMLYTFGATTLTYDSFIRRYCKIQETGYGIKILGNKSENISELKNILSKVMLRRKKEEVMKDLPKIFYQNHAIPPGEVDINVQSSFIKYVYEGLPSLEDRLNSERALIDAILKSASKMDAMTALESLSKSVSTLRRYTGLQKVPGVLEIVTDELENDVYQKIVIFAIHRDVITMLHETLVKYGAVTLFGGHPPEKKQRNIDKFQNDPRCRVMIANINAAGTSIDLIAAHHVLFIEQSWVPGDNAQAVMRVHRHGQLNTVFVRTYAIADSIDERISQQLAKKTRDLTEIFDDPVLTQITQVYK